MFSLMAPIGLLGFALLAVPVLAHIFKPRRVRVIPFSSLRWLRASRHKLSRRLQLHRLLLFLLRAAFISFLVLASAKPVFNMIPGADAKRRIFILDTGRTMAYNPPDRQTPIALARSTIECMLQETSSAGGDVLVSAGRHAKILIPKTADPTRHLPQLRTIQPDFSETDIPGALRLALPFCAEKSDDHKIPELAVVTDLMAASWSQGAVARFMQELDTKLRVSILDVGTGHPQNAWIADAEINAIGHEGRRVLTVTMNAVGDQAHDRVLRLSGLPETPDQTRKVTLNSERATTTSFDLPPGLNLTSGVACLELEPRDALSDDDVFWLPTDHQGNIRVLLIEQPTTQVAELQPAFHLRAALESLAQETGNEFLLTVRSPDSLSPGEAAAADAIILADVPSLRDDILTILTDSVHEGAGLAVFLGPNLDPNFYNTRLHTAFTPSSSLLPVEILNCINADQGFARLTDVQWEHPLLEALSDPAYGDLPRVIIKTYRKLRIQESRGDLSVLARINEQDPAILLSAYGAGKVLVINSTANDEWNDLPRRKNFLPLMDGILTHLAGGWRRKVFISGETVVMPLPPAAESVTITTPAGHEIQPNIRFAAGKQAAQLASLNEIGVYHLCYKSTSGKRDIPFVIQASRRGSALNRISENALKQWWAPAELKIVAPNPETDTMFPFPIHRSLELWLLLCAFIVLLAEMFLVHKACPQAPPPITERPHLASNGFFKPDSTPPENA